MEAAEAGATSTATAAEPLCTSGAAVTAAARQSSASGVCAAQASATRAAAAAESPHSSGATEQRVWHVRGRGDLIPSLTGSFWKRASMPLHLFRVLSAGGV